MLRTLRQFAVPLGLSAIVVLGMGAWRGTSLAVTVLILAGLEFVFSFDNAVVNSKILVRMTPFWQKMFLTFGLLFAVGFMRLLFPILVVVTTAHLGFNQAIQLALHDPKTYGADLNAAHPAIVALGGTFLLMIFLDWIFSDHDIDWLGPIERGIKKLASEGHEDITASVVALAVLWTVAKWFSGGHTYQMLLFGVAGWILYQSVNLIGNYTEERADAQGAGEDEIDSFRSGKLKLVTGAAAFALFWQLEFIDASFSFDGVSGAFAVTSDIFAIMAGLGIGALFIRTLTVKLVKEGTLGEYVFLDHGAHWAIGALAVLLLATVTHEASEYVTGGIGLVLIILSYVWSLRYRRNNPAEAAAEAAEVNAELDARNPAIH
jgi:hypothetical protein